MDRSLDEARRLAAKQPEIELGTGGWVKIATAGKGPPAKVLERWVGDLATGGKGEVLVPV